MRYDVRGTIGAHREAIVYTTIAFSVAMTYAIGIARYRLVLVFALYFVLKSIENVWPTRARLSYLLLPIFVVTLIVDIHRGPLYPIFETNSLVLGLAAMLMGTTIATVIMKRAIVAVSHGDTFVYCPVCLHDNNDIVTKCRQCSYPQDNASESATSTFGGTVGGLPRRVMQMLGLHQNEQVVFKSKLFPNRSVFEDGTRVIRKYLVVTSQRLIFIDYFYFAQGWRERRDIPLENVSRIDGSYQKNRFAKQPVLTIRTRSGSCFEVVYELFADHKKQIPEIATAIKKLNPKVGVHVDLTKKLHKTKRIYNPKLW